MHCFRSSSTVTADLAGALETLEEWAIVYRELRGFQRCTACFGKWLDSEDPAHAQDCPYVVIKRALDGVAGLEKRLTEAIKLNGHHVYNHREAFSSCSVCHPDVRR